MYNDDPLLVEYSKLVHGSVYRVQPPAVPNLQRNLSPPTLKTERIMPRAARPGS